MVRLHDIANKNREDDMTRYGRTTLKTMLLGIGLVAAASAPVLAQKGLDEPFQGAFKEALAGKTVAFVPVAMNFDLTEGWFAGLKRELEPYGVKVVVRDPNWSTDAGAQAVTTLISEKPAVMVIHNPDVQTYAKLLQRAENDGIYVVQINMGSAYRSSGFVGANWIEIGEKDTEAVVKACEGKSNKIAIVQGALSAAASATSAGRKTARASSARSMSARRSTNCRRHRRPKSAWAGRSNRTTSCAT